MKKFVIATMIAACVALCAAVWPHGNAVEETPVPAAETAVSAKEATVAEIEEPATLAEKEKRTIPPKTPDNLKAYILKIARNQALKKYEHIHAAKRDIDMCLPYEELSNYLAKAGEEDWENNELKDIVEDFLESLQKPHRQVFVLRYWYFMSVKEIMKCCNMSKSKVETILFRTRKKLREQLAERKYL